jgi:hypothetical protein
LRRKFVTVVADMPAWPCHSAEGDRQCFFECQKDLVVVQVHEFYEWLVNCATQGSNNGENAKAGANLVGRPKT